MDEPVHEDPERSSGQASLEDAQELISALPEVTEGTRYGQRTWFVRDQGFAWERPFSKADVKRFGDEPVPRGPILALAVEDLAEKAAVLDAGHDGIFTIAHFDDYPAVLIQLDVVERDVLEESIIDAWLACAPGSLAHDYLSERRRDATSDLDPTAEDGDDPVRTGSPKQPG